MDLAAIISSFLATGSSTGSSASDIPIIELLGALGSGSAS
ncbi:hypothetical protein SAMN05421642_102460 [Rhodococcoides kyotonense]|uniref:Uncharacterized protein n=1 Tax=Rhodococcoides kyotonense TaxID=398843 RepID=A0A239ELL7_9NOCA|nr:hypothetical protein SAMN05421642_102460 [Rhodococcus kyotonensis]